MSDTQSQQHLIETEGRNSRRFPKSSIRILKKRINTNAQDLHPTDTQKRLLHDQTGLTVQQISTWFANVRRRKSQHSGATAGSHGPGRTASILVPNVSQTQDREAMNPLERWRNSPPKDEPASFSAIRNAIAQDEDSINDSGTNGLMSTSLDYNTARPQSEASFESLSSFWMTGSSSSAQSVRSDALSATSTKSWDNKHHLTSRRRRSAGKLRAGIQKAPKEQQPRLFQCTFCTDTFKTKYDWTRHEGTLHLVLEHWMCTLDGPTYFDEAAMQVKCAFCDDIDPSDAHVLTHNYDECVEKPTNHRSFSREDHLQQHLRLVHGSIKSPQSLISWKTTISHVNCRCGFCGQKFVSWASRNEHLAEHFRDGKKMKEWTGDRGIEPAVCVLVENAMPPYLIGAESTEFEPFSALDAPQADVIETAIAKTRPTRFEDLTVQLAQYVQAALISGTLINDDVVRRQARLITFGDDDAWNQTPADNAEWLRLFKAGLGLGIGTDVGVSTTTTSPHDSADASLSYPLPATEPLLVHPYTTTPSHHHNQDTIEHTQSPYFQPQSQWPSQGIPTVYNYNLATSPAPWQSPECLAEFRQMQQDSKAPFVTSLRTYSQQPSEKTIDDLLAEVRDVFVDNPT